MLAHLKIQPKTWAGLNIKKLRSDRDNVDRSDNIDDVNNVQC